MTPKNQFLPKQKVSPQLALKISPQPQLGLKKRISSNLELIRKYSIFQFTNTNPRDL